jgi:hypothetical protein
MVRHDHSSRARLAPFLASNSVQIDLLIAKQMTALGYQLRKDGFAFEISIPRRIGIHGQESFDLSRG